MRSLLKNKLAKIAPDSLERVLALSILKNQYGSLSGVKYFGKREDLWTELLSPLVNDPITLLEFGVFEGYSIEFFAKLNKHPESRFYGFDSFEGLPEDWTERDKKGAFNVGGSIPKIDDSRVSFVKGWFQNTLPDFLAKNPPNKNLVVHYDADIYSATLYVLMLIDSFKLPYLAIFDEFTGHETRALYNYTQATGAGVDFLGKTLHMNYPVRVSSRITPAKMYTA